MRIISTHARSAAVTGAVLAVLLAAVLLAAVLLPVSSPAAADGTLGTRHQHDLANRASWEYDGTASSSTASTRASWGDHPLRVQAHATATGGLVDVVVVAHPADRVSPVRVTGLVVDVVVTDPDGVERVVTLEAGGTVVVDATGLTLTATVPAGGPGGYTLTGTAAYTVVPAPEPEPTTTPPAPTAPTPPTPTSPPVAKQAAAASPVAAPPAYTG